MTGIRHHSAETDVGSLHFVAAGEGDAVLLLHQTPRSWDEYRDVVPLLARERRVIALDSLGFGESARPRETLTIELLARGAVAVLDALAVERFDVVGHHTGGVIAFEIAAAHPDRVRKLVLSATPLVDAGRRERLAGRPIPDDVVPRSDGSHLLELWRQRRPYYPPDRIDLLERFVADALRAGVELSAAGHAAVHAYSMESKLAAVATLSGRTLLVRPLADPFAVDEVPRLAAALGAPMVEVENGMVPLPDQLPEVFARIVSEFLT